MKTKITRAQVYRAMMARETESSIVFPRQEEYTDRAAWIAAIDEYEERSHAAHLKTLEAFAVILNTLIDEMGLSVASVRQQS